MFDAFAIRRDFSRAAGVYDEQAILQATVRAQCLQLATEHWPQGIRVLDLGCGTGTLATQAGASWHMTGLDAAFGMCTQAHAKMAGVVNGDAAALPFADGTFDGIFSSLMLQWADRPLAVLREMYRVLRPGGSCVVTTFVEGTLAELREVFAAMDDGLHVSSFAHAPDLLACAVHAGFSVPVVEEENRVEHYADALSLMRTIRSIGASNKQAGRRKGLMTPRQLSALAQDYQTRFSDKKGVYATWRVLAMVMEKH